MTATRPALRVHGRVDRPQRGVEDRPRPRPVPAGPRRPHRRRRRCVDRRDAEAWRRTKGAVVLTHARRSGAGAAIRTALKYAIAEGFDVARHPGRQRQGPAAGDRAAARADRRRRLRLRAGIAVPARRRLRQHAVLPPARHALRAPAAVLARSWAGGSPTRPTGSAPSACRRSAIRASTSTSRGSTSYELEPYLFFKMIRLGYKVTEVPVTKIYPPHELGYTKMKPITGWWSILRPAVPARTSHQEVTRGHRTVR